MLDPKSQACTFLGYYDKTKAYRLYNPKTYKVIVYRYIIFDEGGEWDHQHLIDDDESNEDRSSKVKPLDQTRKENSSLSNVEEAKQGKRIHQARPSIQILDQIFSR